MVVEEEGEEEDTPAAALEDARTPTVALAVAVDEAAVEEDVVTLVAVEAGVVVTVVATVEVAEASLAAVVAHSDEDVAHHLYARISFGVIAPTALGANSFMMKRRSSSVDTGVDEKTDTAGEETEAADEAAVKRVVISNVGNALTVVAADSVTEYYYSQCATHTTKSVQRQQLKRST